MTNKVYYDFKEFVFTTFLSTMTFFLVGSHIGGGLDLVAGFRDLLLVS